MASCSIVVVRLTSLLTCVTISDILSGKNKYTLTMGKSCCAIKCVNRYWKGCGLTFYSFPTDPERRTHWFAAVAKNNWTPNEYSWLCSADCVTGTKSDDPLSPDFVPTLFSHVGSPIKRKAERDLTRYERTREVKKEDRMLC